MLGIPLGLITANAAEWIMHKYVLHDMGRDPKNFWAFHFHEHHKVVRKNAYHDPNYEKFPLGLHAQGKEAWSLLAASAVVVPSGAILCGHTLVLRRQLLPRAQKIAYGSRLGAR